jgi:hypothetical protein
MIQSQGRTTLGHATLGAITIFICTFIPYLNFFAPLIGGAISSYLHQRGLARDLRINYGSAAKIGGLAGVIAFFPILITAWLLFGLLASLLTGLGFPDFGAVSGILILMLTLMTATIIIGFSALGGILGLSLASSGGKL